MAENKTDKVAALTKELHEKDLCLQKSAFFGKQLLEEKTALSERLHQILSENEALKQAKYSLQLDLEAQIQTVNSQSSETELLNKQYENLKKKHEATQKEYNSLKIKTDKLTDESEDHDKNLQKELQKNNDLSKQILSQEKLIQSLQHQADSWLNATLQHPLDEEDDINFLRMQNQQLQDTVSEFQCQLKVAQSEASRWQVMIQELEAEIQEKNQEIKNCTIEMRRLTEIHGELELEIERLKLEQFDENKRGNSVFGEVDDQRKLVEKENKLLVKKNKSLLANFNNIKQELTSCKGHIASLLSMTSRGYHTDYIKHLEDNCIQSKQELASLSAKLSDVLRKQKQQEFDLGKILGGGSEYDYLRLMYEQSEEKNRTLELDLSSQRFQNMSDKDELLNAQTILFHMKADRESLKTKNMMLQLKIDELTLNPVESGSDEPCEEKVKIEVLPGYNLTPTTVRRMAKDRRKKDKQCSDDIVPGELALIDGEFQEVKKPTKSNRAIIRPLVEKTNIEESEEFSPEIRFLEDNSKPSQGNGDKPPSYARFRPQNWPQNSSSGKTRNNDKCKQQ